VPQPLERRVLDYIRQHALLRPGDRAAVAVSGGADSVALLRLMLVLRGELGLVLSIAHFNHKIRGEASDADENFVRELAQNCIYLPAMPPPIPRRTSSALRLPLAICAIHFFAG